MGLYACCRIQSIKIEHNIFLDMVFTLNMECDNYKHTGLDKQKILT